jgi:hypothetical protein
MNLYDLIRHASSDPGQFVTRLGVGFEGFEAEDPEPLYVWQARAIAYALAEEMGKRHFMDSNALQGIIDELDAVTPQEAARRSS